MIPRSESCCSAMNGPLAWESGTISTTCVVVGSNGSWEEDREVELVAVVVMGSSIEASGVWMRESAVDAATVSTSGTLAVVTNERIRTYKNKVPCQMSMKGDITPHLHEAASKQGVD